MSGVLVEEQTTQQVIVTAQPPAMKERVADAASFWMIILVSALAIAALAIATPLVLVVSALIGAFDRDGKQHLSWRSAQA